MWSPAFIPKRSTTSSSGLTPFIGPFDGLDTTGLHGAYAPCHRLYSSIDPNVIEVYSGIDLKATNGTINWADASGATQAGGLYRATSAYNQISGSGHFKAASTISPQPYNSGLIPLGDGYGILFPNSGSRTLSYSAFPLPQPFTIMVALRFDSSSNQYVFKNPSTIYIGSIGGNLSMYAGSVITNGVEPSPGTEAILTAVFNGASSRFRVNGAEVTGDCGSNNPQGTSLSISSSSLHGVVGAWAIWSQAIDNTIASAYENAMASLFGI